MMRVQGIITAMVTPFDEKQNINVEATKQHVDNLINKGVDGLFILGTNGEFHVLSFEEKVAYAKIVIEHTAKRVPVYVGAGACGTQETIKLAQAFEQLGADALSVITPYLVKVSQAELIEHYKMIAAAVKTPIILYNIPANTGINIEPETLKVLSTVDNIIAIKDSSGNLDTIDGYLAVAKDQDFDVLIGSDSKILTGLKKGASGAVASTSNVITEHVVSLYQNFKAGNLDVAETMQKDIDVIRGVFKLASVPAIVKRCVTKLGINVGEARYPVASVGSQFDQEITEMLKFYKIM